MDDECDAGRRDRSSSPVFRWYLVVLLMLIYASNMANRYALSSLVEPIKNDLGLSDSVIGLINGLAFSVFYAILAVPFTLVGDRTSRRWMLTASVTLYSVMIGVCGLAQNVANFVLARIGLAIGEAPTTPVSAAILGTLFPPEKLNLPMAVFSIGAVIGAALGFYFPALINETWNWRVALGFMAVPGLVLAIIFVLTVSDRHVMPSGFKPIRIDPAFFRELRVQLAEALVYAREHKTMRQLFFGTMLISIPIYGVSIWLPALIVRTHGLPNIDAAAMVAAAGAIGGGVGILSGGYLAQVLGKHDVRWHGWVLIALVALSIIPTALMLLGSGGTYLSVFVWLYFLTSQASTGPLFSIAQNIAAPAMKAVSFALFLLIYNLFGLGVGGQAIGILSDVMRSSGVGNDRALAYAMAICTIPALLASIYFFVRLSARIPQSYNAAVSP